MPIKVLLADDAASNMRAIRGLLDDPEFEIVGEAADYSQVVQMTHNLKPDILVMDLGRPSKACVAPPEVKTALDRCNTPFLAISFSNDDDAQKLASSFGASVLLDKLNLYSELSPNIKALVGEPSNGDS